MPLAFHMDRSDIYRHINTAVYMSQAQDYLALLYHKVGGDAGRLRFREITIYFRKPFVPGQAAEVELDFVEWADRFHGAVRFYHSDGEGTEVSGSRWQWKRGDPYIKHRHDLFS